jgi:hypothetical protein
MRDYQIQGLNWLIGLFENGINGILADEMVYTLEFIIIGSWKNPSVYFLLRLFETCSKYYRSSSGDCSKVYSP